MEAILELLNFKKEHLARLANANGAAGELQALAASSNLIGRPKGAALNNLLAALEETGIRIRRSSFDAIAVPHGTTLDLLDLSSIRSALPALAFVEIKTANQSRVKPDFSGFFFAFTEGEIAASEALGGRHRVLLLNKVTGSILLTSIPTLLARAKSLNWQVSVQL